MRHSKLTLAAALLIGFCLGLMASTASAAVPRGEACLWIDRHDSAPLVGCAATGDLNRAQTLVGSGTDVNARTDRGMTALMMAALNGHAPMVTFLLDRGADPNLQDLNGDSALTLAATKGYTDVAEVLVARGAAVDSRSVRGFTPLMWAAAYGHTPMAKLLISKGADVNATIQTGWTCELEDCKFKTALQAAQMNGHQDIVKLLKQAGAKA